MAPVEKSDPTPQRILAAAVDEFAEHGLAGARVDRLASRAGSNKQRIYAYFGNKEQLFDAVIEARIADLVDAVPFDPDDLPGYAARLVEFNGRHPELVRLLLWHRLERPGELARLPESVDSTAAKVAALTHAMTAAPDRFPDLPAEVLLARVLAVVHGATVLIDPGDDVAAVSQAVRDTVADLVTR